MNYINPLETLYKYWYCRIKNLVYTSGQLCKQYIYTINKKKMVIYYQCIWDDVNNKIIKFRTDYYELVNSEFVYNKAQTRDQDKRYIAKSRANYSKAKTQNQKSLQFSEETTKRAISLTNALGGKAA